MKKFSLSASIFLSSILLSSSTFASVSYKGEVYPIIGTSTYHWTGFYAGGNVGVLNHTMNITDIDATSFNATLQQASNPRLTGGLQAGYRHQLDLANTSGLLGIELSANFADASFSKEYGSPFALYQLSSEHKLKALYLLELIGGITANRTLLFLSAGLSLADITGRTTNLTGIPFFNSFSVSKKAFGSAFGGGMEYSFNEKFSLRLKVDFITPNRYSVSDDLNDDFQISNSIVQTTLGVNYRFA